MGYINMTGYDAPDYRFVTTRTGKYVKVQAARRALANSEVNRGLVCDRCIDAGLPTYLRVQAHPK